MKLRNVVILIILIIIFTTANWLYSQGAKSYVGIKSCKKCHEAESIGNQYKNWQGTPHAKAYRVLLGSEAVEIAKKNNVATPETDLACLKCHTTGGGKYEISKTEGVGCEACHGPGSQYNDFENHASYENREVAYKKAVSKGMYPINGLDGIKNREKLCLSCHNNNRPCITESKYNKNISLDILADFVFKHPIRK